MSASSNSKRYTEKYRQVRTCLSQFPPQTRRLLIEQLPALFSFADSPAPLNESEYHREMTRSPFGEHNALAHSRRKFQVAFSVNAKSQLAQTILTREVLAPSKDAAVAFVVHLLLKEYPPGSLARMDLRHTVEILQGAA
jgi:hypothetical protein